MNFRKRLRFDDKIEYYKQHLEIVNALLTNKLTTGEINILAHFMDERMDQHSFGTTSKKIVREKLEISDSNLSNTLKRIAKKGVIEFYIDSEGVKRTRFVRNFIPGDQQDYQIRIDYEGKGTSTQGIPRLPIEGRDDIQG